jgi:rhamnose utilization protein RhaD (predicted bifunctional aldolase and dehydrogenase)
MTGLLTQLIEMSRQLGDPVLDLAILGEGNTSARADEDSFWVKASGTQLARADHTTFVRVRTEPILSALSLKKMTDEDVRDLLTTATIEGHRMPSIETFLHAECLRLPGVQFVGHTHPTAAVALLCSRRSREVFAGALFPDQVVLLGSNYVYVPYADPGLPLAQTVLYEIEDYVQRHHRTPRVILMENHGVIALGSTPQEVLNISQMLVKTCRVLTGSLAAGGPQFLTAEQIERIDKRPDERARRADLK